MSRPSPLTAIFLSAAAACGLAARAAASPDADALFRELDQNHDGVVTRDEAGPEHQLLFDRLLRTSDDNHDGKLTAQEFDASLQPVRADKNMVEKQGSKLPGADALAVMLSKMDASGDQQLESKEIPSQFQPLFERMLAAADSNKDGRLDAREIAQGAPRLGVMARMAAGRMGIDVEAEVAKLPAGEMQAMDRMDANNPAEMLADPAQAEQLFARLDANGDHFLSADEAPPGPFGQRFADMLARNDRDGDGKLSKAEFMEVSRKMAAFNQAKADPTEVKQMVRQLLVRFDKNGDGKLSAQETPPRLAENFDRADQDANGLLEGPELAQVAETMSRMQKMAGSKPSGFGPAGMTGQQPKKTPKAAGAKDSKDGASRQSPRKKADQD